MTIKEFEIQLALGSLSWDNKIDLADNKRTSKKILTILSTDNDWFVRSYISDNPNTPIDVLEKLSKDDNINVRYYVAENPSTPIEILKKLSKDEDSYIVRECAVRTLKEK